MMRESGKTGYCVTCLKCGKIHQKGYAADAIFICPKCGYENYVYLKNGVQIEMSAAQMQSQQFLARVRKFALSLEQLTREEKEDTLLEENPRK